MSARTVRGFSTVEAIVRHGRGSAHARSGLERHEVPAGSAEAVAQPDRHGAGRDRSTVRTVAVGDVTGVPLSGVPRWAFADGRRGPRESIRSAMWCAGCVGLSQGDESDTNLAGWSIPGGALGPSELVSRGCG